MKAKLAKLVDVKSIVTLLLTIVFCILCIIAEVPQALLTIYTVVIGFYFGTQAAKSSAQTSVPANTQIESPEEKKKE